MTAAANEHSNSCAYCSSLRSLRASASSLAGMSPVSLALSIIENQPGSDCERRHRSKKPLRPLGVPMNTAQQAHDQQKWMPVLRRNQACADCVNLSAARALTSDLLGE